MDNEPKKKRSAGRPGGKTDTAKRIIDAAFFVAEQAGLESVTTETVAESTGISKNALRYHFPSKAALLKEMLKVAIAQFDAGIEVIKADDHGPGAWLRAYIRGCFGDRGQAVVSQMLVYIASLGRIEGLNEIFREAVERWSFKAVNDGIDPVFAQIARLAADGLWWSEVYQAPPLDEQHREELYDSLMHLAGDSSDAAAPPSNR